MTSTTQTLIDRVRAREGLTSDGQVAAALAVTRAAVSRWRKGHDAMSLEVLKRAKEILDMPDAEYVELGLQLMLDRDRHSKHVEFWGRVLDVVKRGARAKGRAASVLFGTVLVLGSAALPSQRVAANPAEGTPGGMYIKLTRRRIPWRELARWLGTPFCGRNCLPLTNGIVTAAAI